MKRAFLATAAVLTISLVFASAPIAEAGRYHGYHGHRPHRGYRSYSPAPRCHDWYYNRHHPRPYYPRHHHRHRPHRGYFSFGFGF